MKSPFHLGSIWKFGPRAAVLVCLLLTGCDRDDLLKLSGLTRVTLQQKNTPQLEENLARRCDESIRQGRYEKLTGLLDPKILDPGLRDKLVAVTKAFPDYNPVSVKTIDSKRSNLGDATVTTIVLEYEFAPTIKTNSESTESIPGSWVFVDNVIQNVGGSPTVTGIDVQPSSESVESINAFTLADRGISQYVALFLALLLSAFIVWVVVLCIRAKIGKQKWLWLLLIFAYVGHASVDWTTGHWSFTPLSIRYGVPPIPANMSCSAYGPWMMDLSLPLGALVFLAFLRRQTARANVTTDLPVPNPDSPAITGGQLPTG